MPELPEVETTRRGLEPLLKNQIIKRIHIHRSKLRWVIPKIVKSLEQQILISITRRGKYLIFTTQKGSILIHLGMSGYLQLLPENQPLKKHDHFEMAFGNGYSLRLNDSRRFGAVLYTQDPKTHPLLNRLGIEPLNKNFNSKFLFKKLQNTERAIKLCIMDSSIVVGIGNIYANESLFLAKINPNRQGKSLTISECNALVTSAKKVLRKAIKAGGTTIKDFQNAEGKPGYFSQKLKIYGRTDKNCYNCNQPIRSSRLGQRITLWCDSCQI